MKDTRTLLDDVRPKVPPDAKLLVCWMGADGILHASQANTSQTDVARMADALKANTLSMPGGIIRAA